MSIVGQVLEMGTAGCRRWGDDAGATDGELWRGRVSVHAVDKHVGLTAGSGCGQEKGRADKHGLA